MVLWRILRKRTWRPSIRVLDAGFGVWGLVATPTILKKNLVVYCYILLGMFNMGGGML